MPQIDQLLQAMRKFGANGALLKSGEKVQMAFPTGNRYTSQTTPHDSLVAMIEEILPAEVTVAPDGSTEFVHETGATSVRVRVQADGEAWRVSIEQISSRPAPAPEPAPAARAVSAGHAVAAAGRNAIERLLLRMLALEASDLHLTTGSTPFVRIHGVMQPMPGSAPLTADELYGMLTEILPARNREEFERRNDTDLGYAIPGASRFRVNVYRDRRGPGAVFRAIPFQIRTPEELGLPASVLELCDRTKGLVLVTGPTGSGKSTTLATLIDHINRTRTDHIVTIEDPIEFVHENKKCLVNQREVHSHTDSFKDALRAALREDPDVVLVGELRDLETIAIAVETAETGHLVFGTLHTSTAPSTIDRVIDQFPADRQDQIRQMLAGSLIGVIAQVLCRRLGGGRVAAYEILIGGSAVSNLIREGKTFQIYSIIQTGRAQGMTTLNDSLITLVRKNVIEVKEAYRLSVNKTEMATLLGREGEKVVPVDV
ncbi:MAG TPA: type IV pilus twitching motility protein PilT [Thermoanaerobaculia bacterium]|nr:type IV pilus twitching motility protein PilT [Thermoanaerobaculia bacterium]